MIGPYHYGERKWDEYLLDLRETLEVGSSAQIVAINENFAETSAEIRETFQAGIAAQIVAINDLSSRVEEGLEHLRAEFNWGFTLIADSLAEQTRVLRDVTAKLDKLQETLDLPLRTQARELFNEGRLRLEKGLLEKALERFLQAEQKNDVDFPLQLEIGTLYLYGKNNDEDVINLQAAENHFLLAAKYARAERNSLTQWYRFCGQAYSHAAWAAYLSGQDEKAAANVGGMRACLNRALEHISKAIAVWPQFTEAPYLFAKCSALLERNAEAVDALQALFDRDRRYIGKATDDADFSSIRSELKSLASELLTLPGPVALAVRQQLDIATRLLTDAQARAGDRKNITADGYKGDLNSKLLKLRPLEQRILKARHDIERFDIDVENVLEELRDATEALNSRTGDRSARSGGTELDYVSKARYLLGRGRIIEAIKVVREATGLGMIPARDLVDSWRR